MDAQVRNNVTRRHMPWRAILTVLLLAAFLVAGLLGATPSRAAAAADTVSKQGETSLSVDPATTAPGSSVSVSGSGFAAGETVTVTLSGQSGTLATVQADSSGNLPATAVTIPAALAAGNYTLTATGASSGRVATAPLAVTGGSASLSLNVASILAGGTVQATGSGFAPNESISFALNGFSGILAAAQADGSGILLGTNVTIPASLAAGTYTLAATGATSGRQATVGLTVNRLAPTLTLSAGSIEHGGSVVASGGGFAPGETILFSINSLSGTLAAVEADGSGNLPATSLTIPASLAPGAYSLTATGQTSDAAAGTGFSVAPVTLTVNAGTVTAGGAVTVSGSGFAPNEPVSVTISSVGSALAAAQTDGAGNLPTTTVTIPASLAAGSYALTASGATSGDTAGASLTVGSAAPPSLTLGSATINQGGSTTLGGGGFAAGETVNVTIIGQSGTLVSVQADGSGNLPATSITFPASLAAGTYTLSATGASSGRAASAGLTINRLTPTLTLSAGAIEHGGNAIVQGGGFAPAETVAIALAGQAGTLASVQTDGSGNLPSTTITIPASVPSGSYTLTATGQVTGAAASAGLTVNPVTLTLNPTAVTAGNATTVSGSGFAPNESLTLTLSGSTSALATVQTDGTGNLPPTSLSIPAGTAPGSYTLSASGATTADVAGTSLLVSGPVPSPTVQPLTPSIVPFPATTPVAQQPTRPPSLSLTTGSATQGAAITVSGAGFAPGEAIAITLDGQSGALARVQADASGNLPSTAVTIPAGLAPGSYTLTAAGATSGLSATGSIVVLRHAHSLNVSPASAQTGQQVTIHGVGFGGGEQIQLTLNGVPLSARTPIYSSSNGSFSAAITIPATALDGANRLAATGDASHVAAATTLTVQTVLSPRFYVAGASNTSTAPTTIVLKNAQAQPARVQLTLYFPTGKSYPRDVTMPAHSQMYVAVASLGVPSGTFGLAVSSDRSLSVQVTVQHPGHPSVALPGVAATSTSWQRTVGGKSTPISQLSLLNPAASALQVHLRLVSGSTQRTLTITAPAHSDSSVSLSSLLKGLRGMLSVTSSGPLIAAFN